jgi:hypothetical protein
MPETVQETLQKASNSYRGLVAYRRVHEWPPEPITIGEERPPRYAEAAADVPVTTDVDDALAWVNDGM